MLSYFHNLKSKKEREKSIHRHTKQSLIMTKDHLQFVNELMGDGTGCLPRNYLEAEEVKEGGVAAKRPGNCDRHRKTVCGRYMNKHETSSDS